MIIRKTSAELAKMHRAGQVAGAVLRHLGSVVRPGVSTKELDTVAERMIADAGASPAFKGYHGFPASICTSLNDEVVHGIPSDERVLSEGDILAVDVGVCFKGYFGDAAWTFSVGAISADVQRLLDVTRESLYRGIEMVKVGSRVSDISHTIQSYVEAHGFSVVREFVGHGIGRALHEEPQVPNFGIPGRGPRLAEGMVLAIEPMVNSKGPEVRVLSDNWTAVTSDGGFSAHFEHTVAVTRNGPWVLSELQQ